MNRNISFALILLFVSCSSETPGEYRLRLIKAACDCRNSERDIRVNEDLPDGNGINAMSQFTRDSLLMVEDKTILAINNCLANKKMSGKDIDHFWRDYDIGKMFECDSLFTAYYRYVYQLKHGAF
jgi:hypothetical protein